MISPHVPKKFFISDLKYFVSNLISDQKIFLKCLNKAWIFFRYFISYPNSDQKLAKSRLFLARKKSHSVAQYSAPLIAIHLLYPLGYIP